jgi:hypothetical protein
MDAGAATDAIPVTARRGRTARRFAAKPRSATGRAKGQAAQAALPVAKQDGAGSDVDDDRAPFTSSPTIPRPSTIASLRSGEYRIVPSTASSGSGGGAAC